MAVQKIAIQFYGAGGNQWDEVYGAASPSPVEALGQVDTALINARLRFLDNQNTLFQIRVSELVDNRPAVHKTVKKVGLVGVGAAPDGSGPAATGTAVLFEFPNQSRGSTLKWFRGMPYYWLDVDAETGNDDIAPQLSTAVKGWYSKLVTLGWGTNRVPRLAKTPANFPPITGIVQLADGLTQLTFPALPPLTLEGDQIIIYGTNRKYYPGLRGQWKVQGTQGADKLTIAYTMPPYGQTPPLPGGTARRVGLVTCDPFTGVRDPGFIRIASRSTKNAFFHSRGARSAVHLRK